MPGRRTFFFEGLGVSDGIAIGPAYVLETHGSEKESYQLTDNQVENEVQRLQTALGLARDEVRSIGRQVAEKIDRQQAAIFDAHLLMLEDPYLIDRTIHRIREEKQNAEAIFWAVTKDLGDRMMNLGDEYFAERNHDLYDVARRVIKFLSKLAEADQAVVPREGCIIVAEDLGPAETAQFSRERVLGFCTNTGGATSHTAIMAKALALPAVVGLDYVTHYIRTGDTLILDGTDGKLILNPSETQIELYKRRAHEFDNLRLALGELRTLPAITTDGVRVVLHANIELPEELDAVERNGAEGIGLFRTEFLYMNGGRPSEETDHFREYHEVLERMGDRPVVLRTIDVGGDKLLMDEEAAPEMNPFLGLRAIRLCLVRPEIFRTQLRAMLRAGAGRDVKIMIPMVSCLAEVVQSRRAIDQILADLRASGSPVPRSVQLGIMVEIPSAAIQAHVFAQHVDFFSIGTNDLVQYTLAVDRVNRTVAHLYRPADPSVLRLIQLVVEAAKSRSIPVSVCGEMASDPRLALLLVGLGIRELSMGPSSIGAVKKAIRSHAITSLNELAREVLTLATAEDVETCIRLRLGDPVSRLEDSPVHNAY
ncbi:phosphoenolpyruvate--protein phosphotransferase [Candidatus Poribacteria bacterium]|nr:phosphoenolpyruvate--protein phosphotransferase [Candidatus Poribacteria bacterium]